MPKFTEIPQHILNRIGQYEPIYVGMVQAVVEKYLSKCADIFITHYRNTVDGDIILVIAKKNAVDLRVRQEVKYLALSVMSELQEDGDHMYYVHSQDSVLIGGRIKPIYKQKREVEWSTSLSDWKELQEDLAQDLEKQFAIFKSTPVLDFAESELENVAGMLAQCSM